MKHSTLVLALCFALSLTGCASTGGSSGPADIARDVHRTVEAAVLAVDALYATGVISRQDYLLIEPYVQALRKAEADVYGAVAAGKKVDLDVALQALHDALGALEGAQEARAKSHRS
jgi:hypothetical protein